MTPERPSLEVETRIRARAATVFRYFTDPDAYVRWMGSHAEIDARPGGRYRVRMETGEIAEGRYVVVEPPHRVVFTWGWVGDADLPPGSTTVEVTLHEEGDLTVVRLSHVGLPTDAARELHGSGWRHFLDRLTALG